MLSGCTARRHSASRAVSAAVGCPAARRLPCAVSALCGACARRSPASRAAGSCACCVITACGALTRTPVCGAPAALRRAVHGALLSALCRRAGSISAALRRLPRCAAFIFIRIAGIVRLIRCQCCILPSMMSFRVHFTLYLPSPANKPAIRCAIENTLKASARARIQIYYTIR